MTVVMLVLAAMVVLDLAALRWGADSRDGYASPEWERRRSAHTPGRHPVRTTSAPAGSPRAERPPCGSLADVRGWGC